MLKKTKFKIDLSGWFSLPKEFEWLSKDMQKAMLEDGSVNFPVEYYPREDGCGDKCPKDPLTLYVSLPFGTKEYVGYDAIFKTSLRDCWKVNQEIWMSGDPSYSEGGRRFVKSLRKWADELDASMDYAEKNNRFKKTK